MPDIERSEARDYHREVVARLTVERDRFRRLYEQRGKDAADAEDQLRGAVSTLEAIRDADPVDMALDPQWASRVAYVALKAMGVNPSTTRRQ